MLSPSCERKLHDSRSHRQALNISPRLLFIFLVKIISAVNILLLPEKLYKEPCLFLEGLFIIPHLKFPPDAL